MAGLALLGLGGLMYYQSAAEKTLSQKSQRLANEKRYQEQDQRMAGVMRTSDYDPLTDSVTGVNPKLDAAFLHAESVSRGGELDYAHDAKNGLAGRIWKNSVTDSRGAQARLWESNYLGNWPGAFTGQNTIYSEETRIFRPDSIQKGSTPAYQALSASEQLQKKNTMLGLLGAFTQNRRITLPSNTNKPQLLGVPNTQHPWSSLPNAFAFRGSASRPMDDRTELYRDQFGDANATPVNGPSYPWTSEQYWGNPWGPGGVFAAQFRAGGARDTGFDATTDRQLIPLHDY